MIRGDVADALDAEAQIAADAGDVDTCLALRALRTAVADGIAKAPRPQGAAADIGVWEYVAPLAASASSMSSSASLATSIPLAASASASSSATAALTTSPC